MKGKGAREGIKWHEGLKEVQGSRGKVRWFVDGRHEWGQERSGDCGRAAV